MNYSESGQEGRALDRKATSVYELALTTVAVWLPTTPRRQPPFLASSQKPRHLLFPSDTGDPKSMLSFSQACSFWETTSSCEYKDQKKGHASVASAEMTDRDLGMGKIVP